ncbi:hypothetical protein ZIOFF_015825 [Zingiber officinale]|uniref:HVA22-like protein n=1 Tax=Zingiber officinale TaxID=94328 RepID=A0A8J5LUA1_ZINOF|nr:hypothetical protein ZIOFF_015825 [Zingiber officinale]
MGIHDDAFDFSFESEVPVCKHGMPSFIFRVLILVFGYAYPSYKCHKTIELNKPEIGQLRFWILVALLTVLGAFADAFFSWQEAILLPLYYEAKAINWFVRGFGE